MCFTCKIRSSWHSSTCHCLCLYLCLHMCVSLRCFSTRLSLTQLRRCYLSPPHSHTLQYVSQRGTSTAVRLKYCAHWPPFFWPTDWRALLTVCSCELSVSGWSPTSLPFQSGLHLCSASPSSSSPSSQPCQLLPALTSGKDTPALYISGLFLVKYGHFKGIITDNHTLNKATLINVL